MAKPSAPSFLACRSHIWHRSFIRGSAASAIGRRFVRIETTPSTTPNEDSVNLPPASPTTDARFEVLGSPYSLLSVSLSPSQKLYTRRGTLVALSGNPENAVSTLSILPPFVRALLGIPFLYQKISSTTPATALISTRSAFTSLTVVHLDGRLDWVVAQRNGLLAWTGHSLGIKPTINRKLGVAHWGQHEVTGRGLMALVARGQLYQVHLKAGEEYVVHPSNVVAYTMTSSPPLPYRFKSSAFRFEAPRVDLGFLIPDHKLVRDITESQAWKTLVRFFFQMKTWTRRTIWGDRLFLRFQGPSTVLLQSRASRLSDSLSDRDINEIADSPAGAVPEVIRKNIKGDESSSVPSTPEIKSTVKVADEGGKLKATSADQAIKTEVKTS